MSFKPIPLRTGGVTAPESILFEGGDSARFREIGCLAYVFGLGSEIVLVDTGIADLAMVNRTVRGPNHWRSQDHETIEGQLAKHQIKCSNISLVVLTHMHYDHCSNLKKFPHAKVILSQQEWDYVHSLEVAGSPMNEAILPVIAYLDSRPDDQVEFVATESLLIPGLKLCLAGGHTPGSLMVEADYGNQKYLFTGDAVFLRDNVADQIPIGFSAEPAKSASLLTRLRDYSGILLTGHDLSCMETLGD